MTETTETQAVDETTASDVVEVTEDGQAVDVTDIEEPLQADAEQAEEIVTDSAKDSTLPGEHSITPEEQEAAEAAEAVEPETSEAVEPAPDPGAGSIPDGEKNEMAEMLLAVLRGERPGEELNESEIQTAVTAGIVTQEQVDEALVQGKTAREEAAKAPKTEKPKKATTRSSTRKADIEKVIDLCRAAGDEGLTAFQIAKGLGLIPMEAEEGDAAHRPILKKARSLARDAVSSAGGDRNSTNGRNKVYKIPSVTPVDTPEAPPAAETPTASVNPEEAPEADLSVADEPPAEESTEGGETEAATQE